MDPAAQIEAFAEALDTGETTIAGEMLARDGSLARAQLPDGWPLFLLQANFPDAALIRQMITLGADPNSRSPAGESLLHLTSDPEIIRLLLQLGADINAQDAKGFTPMMAHAPYEETGPDAIYTLQAEGADPYHSGKNGETVFTLLPEGPRFDQLRRLLRQKRSD